MHDVCQTTHGGITLRRVVQILDFAWLAGTTPSFTVLIGTFSRSTCTNTCI